MLTGLGSTWSLIGIWKQSLHNIFHCISLQLNFRSLQNYSKIIAKYTPKLKNQLGSAYRLEGINVWPKNYQNGGLNQFKKQLIGWGFTWVSSSKVCTGPGKSWNYIVAFSRTGKFCKKATGSGKFWKSVHSTKCLKHQRLNLFTVANYHFQPSW